MRKEIPSFAQTDKRLCVPLTEAIDAESQYQTARMCALI